MNVTIGILAHVDAGKTTLSEQLLYHCGATRKLGRVDRGDALLDFAPVERERGVTVFAAQADFFHGDKHYFLLDTPGHADFRPELERCLAALDLAILLVSCTGGPALQTERLWRLLEARGIPTILFFNKTDCPGAGPEAARAALEARLGVQFCGLHGGLTDEAREQIALTDEAAMDAYLEGSWSDADFLSCAARAVERRELFPAFHGSALTGEGVEALLLGLDALAPAGADSDGPPAFLACQVRRDGQGERAVLGKVLSGTLLPRQSLGGEKIHELRRCRGARWTPLDRAGAGELVALTGLRALRAGDRAVEDKIVRAPLAAPPFLAKVDAEVPVSKLLEIFRTLEDEEPTLSLHWDEALRELRLALSGPLQPEVLRRTVQERFGVDVTFGEPRVAYRETVARPVYGCGHFEPLRHYAEVHLLLEPAARGSGLSFESRCPTDALARNWQRLIETHVFEREHPGPLTGSPLTDARVVLLAGRAHEKHTEGGDFREATCRAIRQALFSAASSNNAVLLEPWYRFAVQAEPSLAGRIQTELAALGAHFDLPGHYGTEALLKGRCPVKAMLGYSGDFASNTRGRAELALTPDGFEPCGDQDAAVAASGYERERDAGHPAGSVFCSHGAGHTIRWDEAPAHMHIQIERPHLGPMT